MDREDKREPLLYRVPPSRGHGISPKGDKCDQPDKEGDLVRMFASLLLNLLEELPSQAGESVSSRYQLKKRIERAQQGEQLLQAAQDVLERVRSIFASIQNERRQVARFAQDIAMGLREMEEQILSSLEDTRRARRKDRLTFERLDQKVEEIQDTTLFTRTLEELRKGVIKRLQSIRRILERKRRRDEALTAKVNRELGLLQRNLRQMKKEVDKAHRTAKELEQKALLDPLTGIFNRRALEQRLRQEFHRFKRYGQLFSLLLLDVDRFKLVNDRYGHTVGDQCLQRLVRLLQPVLRQSDFFARYGGEEFVLILPGTDSPGAHALGERIRSLVNTFRFSHQQNLIPLTVSIGVTQAQPPDGDHSVLFNRLDKALYEAKRRGRNCVVSL